MSMVMDHSAVQTLSDFGVDDPRLLADLIRIASAPNGDARTTGSLHRMALDAGLTARMTTKENLKNVRLLRSALLVRRVLNHQTGTRPSRNGVVELGTLLPLVKNEMKEQAAFLKVQKRIKTSPESHKSTGDPRQATKKKRHVLANDRTKGPKRTKNNSATPVAPAAPAAPQISSPTPSPTPYE
jgi:hypothetical protein